MINKFLFLSLLILISCGTSDKNYNENINMGYSDQNCSNYLSYDESLQINQNRNESAKNEIEKARIALEDQLNTKDGERKQRIKALELSNSLLIKTLRDMEEDQNAEIASIAAGLETIKILLNDVINASSSALKSNSQELLKLNSQTSHNNVQLLAELKSDIEKSILETNESTKPFDSQIQSTLSNQNTRIESLKNLLNDFTNRINGLENHLNGTHNFHIERFKKLADNMNLLLTKARANNHRIEY